MPVLRKDGGVFDVSTVQELQRHAHSFRLDW